MKSSESSNPVSALALATFGCSVLVFLAIPVGVFAPLTDAWANALIAIGVFSAISSIPLGHVALRKISKSNGRLSGLVFAQAGLCFGYVVMALAVLAIFLSPYHGPNPMAAHESAAVGYTRSVNRAQENYLGTHSRYACRLPELLPNLRGTIAANEDELKHFTESGLRSGYIVRIWCPGGSGSEYVVLASPRAFGVSGRKTFCSSQDGRIYWTESNPGDDCVAHKHQLD